MRPILTTGQHASNKRLITFGDNYEKGRAMPYIPDGQVLAVPSRAYPPSSGCSWWKWRKPARSALKVEAVRTFGWLAPGHKFPVGQVDSKNVLLLERAVQNSRVWVMRGFHCCNFGSECPCPVLYVINERELLLGHASIVVIEAPPPRRPGAGRAGSGRAAPDARPADSRRASGPPPTARPQGP